jgi:site-specific DNA recombinase
LEIKIASENLIRPKVDAEFTTFWLHRFRKLDVRQQAHRKMLIDTFINAIYLYDDKIIVTFNYKDGTKAITFDEIKDSDLDCPGAPKKNANFDTVSIEVGVLLLCPEMI